MEEHFLNDYVKDMERSPGLRDEPWYNPRGDCIVYQTADEAIVADRIDPILTIYRSAIDNRPIGFQIKGVQAILRKFGLDGLYVESEIHGNGVRRVSIAGLLLAAYEEWPVSMRRRRAYADVFAATSRESVQEVELEQPSL